MKMIPKETYCSPEMLEHIIFERNRICTGSNEYWDSGDVQELD